MAISCSLWLVLLALLQVLLFVDSLKVSTSSVTRNGIVGRTLVTNYCSSRNICSISCSRSVDRTRRMDLHASLILGVNKYSHDTSCCFVDSDTGKVLFTQAKERITGKKHDGGAVGSLVAYGLQTIGATVADIDRVVTNNHHFRVIPFEKRIPFYKNLNYVPEDYNNPLNLLPNAKHHELSHHLAHAWSVVGTAPFSNGLVVVMDGMGESYKAMMEDMTGAEADSGDYMHDLKLIKAFGSSAFVGQPTSLFPGSGYREAESAYVFDKDSIRPVFKRWSRERSPSELYNHGFENMESLGDWNACGKIMGLAPWSDRKRKEAVDWYYDKKGQSIEQLGLGDKFYHKHNFMRGNPFDGSFSVNWEELDTLSDANSWTESNFGYYANLAKSVQENLEDCSSQLIQSLQEFTGEKNIALAGGVALNSVMNGKVLASKKFENVFVPPAPGDEGIAVGCAMYGYQRHKEEEAFLAKQKKEQESLFNFPRKNVDRFLSMDPEAYSDPIRAFQELKRKEEEEEQTKVIDITELVVEVKPAVEVTTEDKVEITQQKFSAYQGRSFTEEELESVMYDYDPWIVVDKFDSVSDMLEKAAADIADNKVIAWFQNKSEFGQRALGSRSILANPCTNSHRKFINSDIKEREWYRPLAPSVLDEYAGDWFEELENNGNNSPYMSVTATVKADKRAQVPAICHVDNSARLQTVKESDNPLYHQLISAFFRVSKIPMVLNTSFNLKGQPIIETPSAAIKSLLNCAGSIDYLYIGYNRISVKPFPLQKSIHSNNADTDGMTSDVGGKFIYGTPLYISEVANAFGGSGSGAPADSVRCVRVRIQDGGLKGTEMEEYLLLSEGSLLSNEAEWRELPSELHLEILQLLQESPMDQVDLSTAYGDESVTEGLTDSLNKQYKPRNDLTVAELYAALQQLRGEGTVEDWDMTDPETAIQALESINSNTNLPWNEVQNALRWLYRNSLVYFEDEDSVSADDLSDIGEVIDLRGFT